MPIESQFSRDETNALLAIEIANGGELAMLGEVIGAYKQVTHASPDPGQFSQSLGLLVDARLAEFVEYRIGLTPNGRKLLRKAGLPFDISRPGKITGLLRRIPASDLGDGTDPSPSEQDIRSALLDRSYMGDGADEDDEYDQDEDEEYDEYDEDEEDDEDDELELDEHDELDEDEDEPDEDDGDQPAEVSWTKGRLGSLFRRNR